MRSNRYCSEGSQICRRTEQNSEAVDTTRDGPRARQTAEQRGLDRAVVKAREGRSLIQ